MSICANPLNAPPLGLRKRNIPQAGQDLSKEYGGAPILAFVVSHSRSPGSLQFSLGTFIVAL